MLPLCKCVFVFAASEVTNPMQIMFSVLNGARPEISLDSLPADIPSRDTLISLMTTGWTSNPDERPSFLSKNNHYYCATWHFCAASDVEQLISWSESTSCDVFESSSLSCGAFTVISECLVELEPMVRAYDEIDFLEAVLEIKRSQVSGVINSETVRYRYLKFWA